MSINMVQGSMALWWWERLGHLVARARAPCSSQHLSCPEPSVEERLQKLHSEIKFALKVDNPVRHLLHSLRLLGSLGKLRQGLPAGGVVS